MSSTSDPATWQVNDPRKLTEFRFKDYKIVVKAFEIGEVTGFPYDIYSNSGEWLHFDVEPTSAKAMIAAIEWCDEPTEDDEGDWS